MIGVAVSVLALITTHCIDADGEKKWWSIGRGRKDLKEENTKGKENKISTNTKCIFLSFVLCDLG
jgi:hypothetical protein